MTPPSLRWAVVILDLEPAVGHEQGGRRRCLVVSNEPFHRARLLTVVPITAASAAVRYPNEVALPAGTAGQTRDARILCHQIRTLSTARVARDRDGEVGIVGRLDDLALRRQVREAIVRHLWLDRPEPTP